MQTSDRLDLVALRRRQVVVLASGAEIPLAYYRHEGNQLYRQMFVEADTVARGQMVEQLVRLALPTATDEDLADLSAEDMGTIIAAAAGKIALVEAALKNGLSGGDALVVEPPLPSTASTTTTPTQPSAPA